MANWTDRPTSVRKGEELNTQALKKYLLEKVPGVSGSLQIEQFPRGFSNLTYRLKIGGHDLVLRRPPFGANIKTAHDMSREYRILSNLVSLYPKVPRPLLYCDDEKIIGASFYLMERVQGVILRPEMPKEMIPGTSTMPGIAGSLVDTLVELHEVDYEKAGLGKLGKPEGYVSRQIEGWTRRYKKSKTDDIPEIEQVAGWLAKNKPRESGNALIHNDFKYDNLVLAPSDWTEVKAVLDWEMATLGDPLMDLGTSLGYWINPSDPEFMQQMKLSPTTLPGNPSREEIAARYANRSGRDISNIVYYYVYGLFKIAVIVQQIYFRYHKGHTRDPRFARLISGVKGCGAAATRAIQRNQLDNLF